MTTYFDPDFDPLACDDLGELQSKTRALATDIQVRGVGLGQTPIEIARELYGVLLTLRVRGEQWRETGIRAQDAHQERRLGVSMQERRADSHCWHKTVNGGHACAMCRLHYSVFGEEP